MTLVKNILILTEFEIYRKVEEWYKDSLHTLPRFVSSFFGGLHLIYPLSVHFFYWTVWKWFADMMPLPLHTLVCLITITKWSYTAMLQWLRWRIWQTTVISGSVQISSVVPVLFFVRKFRIMNKLSCLFKRIQVIFFVWHVPQFAFVWYVFMVEFRLYTLAGILQEGCILCNALHWEALIVSYVNFCHNPLMRVGPNSFLHHVSPFPFVRSVLWGGILRHCKYLLFLRISSVFVSIDDFCLNQLLCWSQKTDF